MHNRLNFRAKLSIALELIVVSTPTYLALPWHGALSPTLRLFRELAVLDSLSSFQRSIFTLLELCATDSPCTSPENRLLSTPSARAPLDCALMLKDACPAHPQRTRSAPAAHLQGTH